MLMNDLTIAEYALTSGMIRPFQSTLITSGTSYGRSSFGYDLRLGTVFGTYRAGSAPLDPKAVTSDDLDWTEADTFLLPPMGYCLAHSVETLRLPRHVTGTVHDKSSLARCGVQAMNTVLEAGWEGQVTLELTNHINRPVLLRAGEGIVQVLFHLGNAPCGVSYADRRGKYQHQTGVTLPRTTP